MMAPGSVRTGRRGLARGVPPVCRRGLTLLEVILALTLMILLLSSVFPFYRMLVQSRQTGGTIAHDAMLTRALLEQMAIDLRHTTDVVPGDGQGFRGERDYIVIVRARMPELYAFQEFDETVDELPPAQMDLERIRYELLYDEELVDDNDDPYCHGLWRSVQKTFDPNPKFVMADEEGAQEGETQDNEEEFISRPSIDGQLIATEIKYLRFEYFDGAEWHDQWQVVNDAGGVDMGEAAAAGQGGYALPQAVRITAGQTPVPVDEQEELEAQELTDEEEEDEEEYHPDRFTLVVHLPQADPSLISSRQYGVADQLGRQEGVR